MVRQLILPLKPTPPPCQKENGYRRLDRNISVSWEGNAGSRLCWGCLAGAQGRQWAAACGVGCGWPRAHTVLVFHLGRLFTAFSGIFCCPEFCSLHIRDPSFRGRNTISNSTYSILSTTSLELSFQANIISSQHCFPSHFSLRTCSYHFASTALEWRGKTCRVVNEVRRGCAAEADKRKQKGTHK